MSVFKLVLISEAPMSENAGGISQTLANVFSFIEPNNILCVTPAQEIKDYPPIDKFKDRYVSYKYEFINLPGNRFTEKISPFIGWINNSINSLRPFFEIKKCIRKFNPDIIISCPNGIRGIVVHNNLLKKNVYKVVIPYFMDDWMFKSDVQWINGSLHEVIGSILRQNLGWLMVSNELANLLSERYSTKPNSLLIVHNPVDLSDAPEPVVNRDGIIRLAYAGALWDMHMDALCLVAQAVRQLKDSLTVELIVYTPKHFWEWRGAVLEEFGVVYGGSLLYKDVHQKLSEADALVLVASFKEDLLTHTKASLQTKVTDYLKCRKLVISFGPKYAANNNFIKAHNCGVCIESDSVDVIKNQLNDVLRHIDTYESQINNGWDLLVNELSKPLVHKKVSIFFNKVISNTK